MNQCMLSQYDSASGQGYSQLIQTVDGVCSDSDDLKFFLQFPSNFLLMIKGNGTNRSRKPVLSWLRQGK